MKSLPASKLKFIPVRGRKRFRISIKDGLDRLLKFIPVRGRKLDARGPLKLSDDVEIYPREGAETIRIASLLNISDLKFIPVRGRKHHGTSYHCKYLHVEIYPREGTETQ